MNDPEPDDRGRAVDGAVACKVAWSAILSERSAAPASIAKQASDPRSVDERRQKLVDTRTGPIHPRGFHASAK